MNKLYNYLIIAITFSVHISIAQGYQTEMIIAQDGSGDFTTIQAAIDATKAFPDVRITIHLKKGVYMEKVQIYSWNTRISLIGEDRDSTIITFDDHFKKLEKGRNSTFHTYTFMVDGNDFHAENLTIANSSGPVGQAVALHVAADRVSFTNCVIKGYQDTMYLAGEGYRSYFKDCYIGGTTDFIFGEGTAMIENCEIHSLSNSYITAASTPENQPFGLVFLNCQLTAASDVNKVYLGRPWRKYARTVFINCVMGEHIKPEGWHNWDQESNEKTAFYAEYNSFGPGANADSRATWSHQLSDIEATEYTRENVLRDW